MHTVTTLATLEAAARKSPAESGAYKALGAALQRLESYEEAIEWLRKAETLAPSDPDCLSKQASCLLALDRTEDAAAILERVLVLAPSSLPDCYGLASIYARDVYRVARAEALFRRCIELSPNFMPAYVGICEPYLQHRPARDAVDMIRLAVGPAGLMSRLYSAVGCALRDGGRYFEAQAFWWRALSIQPDSRALGGLVDIEILLDRMDSGKELIWRAFCHERNTQSFAQYLHHLVRMGDVTQVKRLLREKQYLSLLQGRLSSLTSAPEWDGSPLEGKNVLVETPGAFGDAIQWSRFVAFMKGCGAKSVVLEARRRVVSILSTIPGVTSAVLPYAECAPIDVRCRADLACFQLDWTWQDLGCQGPFVRLSEDVKSAWRARLSPYTGLRVGLQWRGAPHWVGDAFRFRSIPLDHLRTLSEIPAIHVFGLQTGPGREELSEVTAPFPIVDLGAELDFMQAAGAIEALDLVITVDTMIAHLAAALGKPCWVMLPRLPCWRWEMHSTETRWYPTLKLYRQQEAWDWNRVVDAMRKDLEELAASSLRAAAARVHAT